MKAVLQQQKNERSNSDTERIESKSEETRVNEVLSRYFVWFMNNNIEEFQKLCTFWNQRITNQSSIFLRQNTQD